MKIPVLKTLERGGKRVLTALLASVLPGDGQPPADDFSPRRVLIFRLDKRIGNGLLLLPLIRSIRETSPECTVDVLINLPVASLLNRFAPGLLKQAIVYDQDYLFRNPLRWVRLIRQLRRNKYDVVISSSNPDAFSLSQALFARLVSQGYTVGFRWKDSPRFYHVTVASSREKHYADAQVDLWRWRAPHAPFLLGGLTLPPDEIRHLYHQLTDDLKGEVLFWLGATGDKVLPESAVTFIYETLLKAGYERIVLMAGPADRERMTRYSPKIQEKIHFWERPLTDTALYFAGFRLFVSGDTGPMHLAVAVGMPTVTIFTTTNLQQYGYQDGEKHFSLYWRNTPEVRTQLETIISKLHQYHGRTVTP